MKKANQQDWMEKLLLKNKRIIELETEVKVLKQELIEFYLEYFDENVSPATQSNLEGWYGTNATTGVVRVADRLVEFGIMEKHPTAGVGRVQFYRPIPQT